MGTIRSLVYQDKRPDQKPDRFHRITAECVTLIAGHGIDGDSKAGHHPRRQLNIMSFETLQTLAQEGWRVGPGEMGEQIVIEGLDVAALGEGTRIRIGADAVVEIYDLRVPCSWLAEVQGKDHNAVIGRVGVMAGVVQGGSICVGDAVSVMSGDNL